MPELWEPKKEWEREDAFLIGGGSSLLGFDFNKLKGKNTIGANDAFRLGPEVCQICLFGDSSWFQKVKWDLEKFKGRVVSIAPSTTPFVIPWMKQMNRLRDGLHEGSTLGWNYSTGAAAINLAITLGARRVFLLGYDLAVKNGKSHWHKHRKKVTEESVFARFTRGFGKIASSLKHLPYSTKGIEVLNVSDGTSKLACFKTISFEQLDGYLDDDRSPVLANLPEEKFYKGVEETVAKSVPKPSDHWI